MYGFGANSAGQLGMGAQTVVSTPAKIDNIDTPADMVTCGATHTVVMAGNQVLAASGEGQDLVLIRGYIVFTNVAKC